MNDGDLDTISPPDLSQVDVAKSPNDITMQINGDISAIVPD
jgi:hypothetical protein